MRKQEKLINPCSQPLPMEGRWKRRTLLSERRPGSPHARARPLRQKSLVPLRANEMHVFIDKGSKRWQDR